MIIAMYSIEPINPKRRNGKENAVSTSSSTTPVAMQDVQQRERQGRIADVVFVWSGALKWPSKASLPSQYTRLKLENTDRHRKEERSTRK